MNTVETCTENKIFLQASWNTNSDVESNDRSSATLSSRLNFWGWDSNQRKLSSSDLDSIFEQLDFILDDLENSSFFLPAEDNENLTDKSDTTLNNFTLEPDPNHSETTYRLAATDFESITCPASFTVSCLTSISEQEINLNGEIYQLVFCDSLQFWKTTAFFSLFLLSRGKFIPSIVSRSNILTACWLPILTEKEDQKKFLELIESIPISSFASMANLSNISKHEVVLSFIRDNIDALIRTFLKNHELAPEEIKNSNKTKDKTVASWLEALRNNSKIDSDFASIEKLRTNLSNWNKTLTLDISNSKFDPILRLEEPEDDSEDSKWKLSFYVKLKKNSKKPLSNWSFSRIKSNTEEAKEICELNESQIEETFLAELGRVSLLCPYLDTIFEKENFDFIELNISQSYDFLTRFRPLLEQSNVEVIVPKWWDQEKSSIGLHLEVKGQDLNYSSNEGTGLLSLSSLLDFSWELALGGGKISIEKFKKIMSEQTPIVNIDGNWVRIDPQKAQNALEFVENNEGGKISTIEALRLGFGISNTSSKLPVTSFNAQGWLSEILSGKNFEAQNVEAPVKLNASLRPYQLKGLGWLAFISELGVGGCLADDMGLGKTIQLLSLLLKERECTEEKTNPTLIIVPMSVIDNWEKETQNFAPDLKISIHHGINRAASKQVFLKHCLEADVVITTYSLAQRDEEIISAVPWRRIVLDEAQNIKNTEAKQTKSIRHIANEADKKASIPCHRIALTGTPLENHLQELWSIFDFLNPGLLGSKNSFRTKFIVPIEKKEDEEVAQKLSKLVKCFALRRLKTDPEVVSDLPEKIEMEVTTSLTDEQRVLYKKVVDEMMPTLDSSSGIHRKGLVLSTITKLKQICNHPTLYFKDSSPLEDRSGKLNRLEELLEVILAENDKVLIFTQYAQMGHLLQKHLKEKYNQEVLYLHGSLTRKARDEIVTRFQKEDGPQMFILSLKAGGFGLNLTQANQVIHYDQWWNPAVEEQATDRAYRIGQKRNVQVRKFICKGTLEEKISKLLNRKRNLADQIVGSTKNYITQLSTNELKELLSIATEDRE